MSISNVMDVAEALKLDADSLFTRKAYIGLTSNDEEFLYAAQEYIVQYSDDLTDAFYDYLVQFEPVSDDFRDHNLVSFLKDSHKRYIVRLLSGVYDFDYAIDRLSFGLMYQQLCITPEWYVGAFSFYINAFSEVLALKLAHNPKKLSGTLKALNKVVLLDISLAFDAYEFAHSREVVVARDEVESLYLEQTKQIEHLAFYDALTGLPNRNLLQEKVEHLLTIVRRERRMAALIYIDVINLKEVNDTLGHSVGDKLIREIGQRLYTLVEGIESDEQILLAEALSIARITGDEFCIACLVKDEKTPIEIIKAVDEIFAQPFYINEFDINVRNRYGVVFSPNDGDSFDKLLRHADIALNQAKNKSSHIFFYDSSLGAKLCARAYQAKRLESALVKNKGLELRFQPQVDLSTGKLSGAEVLLRWYDEELGWVSPTVFIPLAEERGFIESITLRVMEMAARQNRIWQQKGLLLKGYIQLKFSVNISARDLESSRFLDELLLRLDSEGLTPDCFELELTETGIMRDPDWSINMLHHIKEKGFSLAIDDFGTGHSSLSYLRDINADLLKIDMSFVHDVDSNEANNAIVRTIIATAGIFGMKTLAEGIETTEVAKTLHDIGCDYGQGYLFSHPLTSLEFENKWLNGIDRVKGF